MRASAATTVPAGAEALAELDELDGLDTTADVAISLVASAVVEDTTLLAVEVGLVIASLTTVLAEGTSVATWDGEEETDEIVV